MAYVVGILEGDYGAGNHAERRILYSVSAGVSTGLVGVKPPVGAIRFENVQPLVTGRAVVYHPQLKVLKALSQYRAHGLFEELLAFIVREQNGYGWDVGAGLSFQA